MPHPNDLPCRWVAHRVWLLAGIFLAMGTLVASRVGQFPSVMNLLLGGGFAVLVAGLAVRPGKSGIYARISTWTSEFSYTLYLVHFPILAFLFYSVFKGQQMPPTLNSACWFIGTLAAITFYASIIWWCFERNTDRIRKKLESLFHIKKSVALDPAV